MNILIITHYYFPHIGGIEIVAENQAKELVKMKHKVTIITSGERGQRKKEVRDGITIIRVPAIHILEHSYHVPFPLFSPALLSIIKTHVQKSDIIHAHGALYLGSVFSAICAKIYKKPFFLTEHVGFVRYKSSLINTIEKIAFSALGRISLSLSKKIFVLNTSVASFIKTYTNHPIVMLANGVDTRLFHPIPSYKKNILRKKYSIPLNKPVVIFVGRFVQKKGIELILNAIDTSYEYIFVGRGVFPLSKKQKNIHVFTSLPQNELAELYQLSDLFLLPSRGEGFPLSILEAMASGLPIITTTENKKIPAITTDVARFINTSQDIKKTIRNLLSHTTLLQNMSKNARMVVTGQFNWKSNTKQLLNFYT